MDTRSITHPPPERVHPEQDEERRRIARRRREEEIEAGERRFRDASRAFYLLVHTDHAPERLERAAKVMDEAAAMLRGRR